MAGFATSKKSKRLSEINMTPFVDIVLVLLIIFIVSAPLMYSSFDVKPPSASISKTQNNFEFVIEIKSNGSLFVSAQGNGNNIKKDKNSVDLENLISFMTKIYQQTNQKQNQAIIYIAADKDCKYSSVIEVVDKLNKHGFSNISFVLE
jgi:biopolymer transport protein TolR